MVVVVEVVEEGGTKVEVVAGGGGDVVVGGGMRSSFDSFIKDAGISFSARNGARSLSINR